MAPARYLGMAIILCGCGTEPTHHPAVFGPKSLLDLSGTTTAGPYHLRVAGRVKLGQQSPSDTTTYCTFPLAIDPAPKNTILWLETPIRITPTDQPSHGYQGSRFERGRSFGMPTTAPIGWKGGTLFLQGKLVEVKERSLSITLHDLSWRAPEGQSPVYGPGGKFLTGSIELSGPLQEAQSNGVVVSVVPVAKYGSGCQILVSFDSNKLFPGGVGNPVELSHVTTDDPQLSVYSDSQSRIGVWPSPPGPLSSRSVRLRLTFHERLHTFPFAMRIEAKAASRESPSSLKASGK